jgi:hypothetical protein
MEDIAFTECSDRYPVEVKQGQTLQGSHSVVFIRTCPHMLGFPVTRKRMFSACINRKRVVWVGPSSATGIEQDFHEKFARPCRLTGSVFFQASAQEVQDMVVRMAARRKHKLPPNFAETPMSAYLHKLLGPGNVLRKAEFEVEHAKAGGGTFLADLDHHPGHGVRAGPLFPTAISHGNVWSFSAPGRLSTRAEEFSALGFDMFPILAGDRGVTPLAPLFAELTDGAQKFLCGNAMHIPAFTMWIAYVLGNCIGIEEFYRIASAVGPVDTEDDDAQ